MKNHRKGWTSKEDVHLIRLIKRNCSIDVIVSQLERSEPAIKTRANYLGFGYYHNKADEKTYFVGEINHKNRRTKDEILAAEGKVPIRSARIVEDHVKKSTVIIAEKKILNNKFNKLDVLKELNKISATTIELIKVLEDAI